MSDDFESALELATQFLGLELGIQSRVEGDTYTLESVHRPEDVAIEVGQTFELGKTYCSITLEANDVVAIDEMSSSPYQRHPCFEAFGLEAYIGVPLRVDGEVYGTLNFSSSSRRSQSWTETDLLLMKLLARWAEGTLKQRQLAVRLENALGSLDDANLELGRRNRDLNAFISAASHDLKEPLRNVDHLAGFVREDANDLGNEAEDNLRMIEETARRGQALIEDMLDFARISRHQNRFEYVDLEELVRGVLSDVGSRIKETGGEVTVSDLPTLWIDRFQVRQLLQNLIGNALKYHREDVPPVVRVEAELVAQDDDEVLELRVHDNGIGFEPVHAARIFEPFRRLHGQERFEGTGVGLAICARIAERLSGSIRATSEPGRGSTFIVTLPACGPEVRQETSAA